MDRDSYEKDKDGKILLHEMAHALDFKGCEAPGLLRKLMGVQGKAVMGTDKNAAFGAVYQKFQSQHMISVAQQALKTKQAQDPAATQVAFSTPFQGGMHAALVEGKLWGSRRRWERCPRRWRSTASPCKTAGTNKTP